MAGKKENLKALFTNTRTRVIIIFTSVLLLIAVGIGIIKLRSAADVGASATASVSGAPVDIKSIPGALDPTEQYAKLQQVQNVEQAKAAIKTGSSAIPTIIRTQSIGSGVNVIGPQTSAGVGFSTLARQDEGGVQRSLWLQSLQNSNCSKTVVKQVISEGATLTDLKAACTCLQLKDDGYQLKDLEKNCSCSELRAAGFNARQLKDEGYTAGTLRTCGFSACELKAAGFSAQEMKDGGFSDGELKGAGFSDEDIRKANGLPVGTSAADIRKAGCQVDALKRLRAAGVSASAVRRISGCSASQLKAAGYSAQDLKNAGFSAADLKNAGFTPAELKQAGFSAKDLLKAGFTPQELAAAGFTPAEIAAAESLPPGVTADDIKNAGCSIDAVKKEIRSGISDKLIQQYAGCSSQVLLAAHSGDDCSVASLRAEKAAGVSATNIKQTLGCSAAAMRAAGFSAADLKAAGFTAAELKNAGFSDADITGAGFEIAGLEAPTLPPALPSQVTPVPVLPPITPPVAQTADAANAQQLQEILKKQNQQMVEQKYQQKIQQRISQMMAPANQYIQNWEKVSAQVYVPAEESKTTGVGTDLNHVNGQSVNEKDPMAGVDNSLNQKAFIKTGDVIFAVLDTSVNSDEPGPILATIVTGKLKGSKLIGSFNLPANANKMVISFNTLSIPGAARTMTISAYAIDPNTARTALSSRTDHHYLLRYGSLFASSFLEGFGNAFQSADTTVTIGGTGGGDNITVQNGINRSAMENAVIALADVGKAWGQAAQQLFSRPTTVELFSGTGMGILFTQDVTAPSTM